MTWEIDLDREVQPNTWRGLDLDPFDTDDLTLTEQRLAETLPPVPPGGRRQTKEPMLPIVRLEDVRR